MCMNQFDVNSTCHFLPNDQMICSKLANNLPVFLDAVSLVLLLSLKWHSYIIPHSSEIQEIHFHFLSNIFKNKRLCSYN
jgi:hypothetical protein